MPPIGAWWDAKISPRANAGLAGECQPSDFGFKGFRKGLKPSDHWMR
jgi:hypothetical protein